jgi:cardiolipin synthase
VSRSGLAGRAAGFVLSGISEGDLSFIYPTTLQSALFLIYVVDVFIAVTVVFLERKNPSATLAWIMVLFLLPGLGIIFYFLFSQNIARRKLFRLTQHEKEIVEEPLLEQIGAIKHDRFLYVSEEEAVWKDLILLNQTYAKAYLTQHNQISLLTDGNHMYHVARRGGEEERL